MLDLRFTYIVLEYTTNVYMWQDSCKIFCTVGGVGWLCHFYGIFFRKLLFCLRILVNHAIA